MRAVKEGLFRTYYLDRIALACANAEYRIPGNGSELLHHGDGKRAHVWSSTYREFVQAAVWNVAKPD